MKPFGSRGILADLSRKPNKELTQPQICEVPKIGVPLNHPFSGFSLVSILGYPHDYGNPHIYPYLGFVGFSCFQSYFGTTKNRSEELPIQQLMANLMGHTSQSHPPSIVPASKSSRKLTIRFFCQGFSDDLPYHTARIFAHRKIHEHIINNKNKSIGSAEQDVASKWKKTCCRL